MVGDRSFSFSELDELSSALAALVRLGVRPGDRVTLYAPNSWEWIVSYYGVLKTGAVINPVNVMLTPAEVVYVTRDCGAKALIGSPEKVEPALRAGVSGLEAIVFGDEAVEGATPFAELIGDPAGFEPVPAEPEALSTIGYTSGTTGHPKGAMQSHRAVMLNGAMTAQMHLKSRARHGRDGAAVPARLRQCRLQRRPHVRADARAPSSLRCGLEMLASIETHRATMFEGVPTMYMYMLAHPGLRRPSTSPRSRAARSAARPCRS